MPKYSVGVGYDTIAFVLCQRLGEVAISEERAGVELSAGK